MIEHFQTSFLPLFLAGFILCQPNSFLVAQTRADVDLFAKHQQELAAENPEGLTFSVKLKDGKTQFHVGEKIRLELSFASSLVAASDSRGGNAGTIRSAASIRINFMSFSGSMRSSP